MRLIIVLGVVMFALLLGRPTSAFAVINSDVLPAAKDATLRMDRIIRNYGVDNRLTVQSQQNQNKHRRAPVEFDLSSIPTSATIEAATLRLYMESIPPSQRLHSVHRITQSWLEGTGDGQKNNAARDGVTWIERRFGDNIWTGVGPWDWSAQGSDFIGAATASTLTLGANGWMNWNVFGDVNDWYNGTTTNFGWLIKDDLENTWNRQRGRYTSREGAAARRPALDVTYLRSMSGISTNNVAIGWYGQLSAQLINNGGPGGDQIRQATFTIPAGWSQISILPASYTVTAPAGKIWNVTSAPTSATGPQTVIVTAATATDDLANGETVDIAFNVQAPLVAGSSIWTYTAIGAAGGIHIPPIQTVNVGAGGGGSPGGTINTTVFPAGKDSTIRMRRPIRNYGVTDRLTVQSRQQGNRHRRALIEFDISSIPANATIESALLRLYMESIPPSQRIHSIHRITQSWLEGTGDGQKNNAARDGVTWIERRFGDNNWTGSGPWDWAAQGGDFIGASTASTPTLPANGWMNWDVMGDVDAWHAASAPNYGWLIKDDLENTWNRRRGRYTSREGAAPRRPALEVTYLRSTSGISTNTVEVGWYGGMSVQLTNNGGPGGDEIGQATFTIPPGWSQISTSTVGYTVTAPAGKTWNVTGIPVSTTGPQTVTVTAATAADGLIDGETVDIAFNLCAPWLIGTSTWTYTTVGAAGGTHIPPNRDVNVIAGAGGLSFTPSIDTFLTPIILTGLDTSTTGNLGALNVLDARGTGTGWNVVIASTDFVNTSSPTQTIPAGGFIVPVAPLVTIISGVSPPVTASGLLAGAGLTIMDAPSGTGMGHYETRPDLRLLVPAETFSGTYTATVTETLVGL